MLNTQMRIPQFGALILQPQVQDEFSNANREAPHRILTSARTLRELIAQDPDRFEHAQVFVDRYIDAKDPKAVLPDGSVWTWSNSARRLWPLLYPDKPRIHPEVAAMTRDLRDGQPVEPSRINNWLQQLVAGKVVPLSAGEGPSRAITKSIRKVGTESDTGRVDILA